MNCPSRTDNTWLHDDWNQNPPRFAPDLTTRQDLIGISNARENQSDENGLELLGSSSNCAHRPSLGKSNARDHPLTRSEASLTKSGRLASRKGPIELVSEKISPKNNNFISSQRVKDWGLWLLSVICMSILISRIGRSKHKFSAQPLLVENSSIERSFVEPEKRSRCASGGVGGDTYDMPLHVAALFIIFFVSGFGCAFPILATRFPRLHVPASFLFFVSHFGTGVLIATAFVHLLPTAFTSLGDPCLSDFWTKDYPAMPGAIALGGIFLVTVIEMVFSPARHVCRGGNRTPKADLDTTRSGQKESSSPTANNTLYANIPRPTSSQPMGLDAGSHLRDMGPLVGRSASISRAINRMGEGNEEIVRVASAPNIQTHHEKDNGTIHTDLEREDDSYTLSPEQKQKKETMQVYLLEMGILFHSVFIGMSLSVSVGKEFVVLLIAIVFHQTFEGLALGSRIASLPWRKDQLQPWIMSLAYGCTTPIGQAIGLATHTLYSPDSEVGLLVVGCMNAMSSGLLIFASLVELMSEDFLSDESWRVLRGRKRVYACILVFLGAFCMSIVGAWA
ncbi:hypothetical protein N7481_009115 [Penicillium waksmanii]|uniref:uncharacterized protein n=1 Tax=Penicillium waksmanii TaxID=69791 RepID=UPI00254943CC|nr:uncharacterized protein N7481_009115 [Penicillium waksmanii]KAJ5975408.1 hypothetical protein N7481_009115 [Penicillium waksmanii]